jgi:hypothetical protein
MDSNTPIKRPPRRRYMDAKSCYVLVLTGPIPSYQQQQHPQERRETKTTNRQGREREWQQDHNKDRTGPARPNR